MPKLTGESPNEKTIAAYENRMIDCIDNFERCWLNSGPFITGDKISAADIWAACELEQPRIAGYDAAKGRPILSGWLNRVQKELNPHYQQAHTFLNKLVEMENKKSAKL